MGIHLLRNPCILLWSLYATIHQLMLKHNTWGIKAFSKTFWHQALWLSDSQNSNDHSPNISLYHYIFYENDIYREQVWMTRGVRENINLLVTSKHGKETSCMADIALSCETSLPVLKTMKEEHASSSRTGP